MRQQSVILAGVAATALLVAAVLPDTSPVAARAAAQQAPLPSASTPSPQVTPAVARPAPGTTPASPSTASAAAVMSRYCVTCHNARLKSGGLELDVSQLANLGANAETLEKVVNKLRTKTMPPAGAPRPDAATYVTATRELETALDREAERHPNLGTLPLAHRLTRTEYRNAIRDLLALEALPRELSIDLLLPADNISSGFDNIADLLFVSPTNLERYLDAARRISRLAVGDPTMPVMVNIYRVDAERPQDDQLDELPFGTRGGTAIRADFPVDATYVIKVELAGTAREPQQLEISVDGERLVLESQGGGRGRGGAPAGRGNSAPAGRAAAPVAGNAAQDTSPVVVKTGNLEYRVPITAGTHLVGVTFVQRTEARDESTLRPRTRSRGTSSAVERVTISGPFDVTGPGDSLSRRRIFTCYPGRNGNQPAAGPVSSDPAVETACARQILSTLARRAYRRPVTDTDVQELMPFYTAGRAESNFDRGIQRALERLLVSPQFLFRLEKGPASPTAGPAARGPVYRISDLELASRLSFFLWSSIPDEELLTTAAAGRLRDPKVVEQQVRRMLADPRADALVTNFAAQWLYLRDIDAKVPDEVLFQNFDETLRDAMRQETELFVASVFRENRSVTDLLTANYTFLNERLARHYGIPQIRGSAFRRVELPPDSVRGGLLGQGSILTITSYANRTSPVLRGKWVLENLLASPPPPPPADVPALKTEGREPGHALTMRDAMTSHRANPACASCHARMDPIGFAMENFDAIGRWRDTDGGQALDVSGVFPEGTTFKGVTGLKRELVRNPEPFIQAIAERLLMYGLGRNLQYYDAPAVRQMLRDAAPRKNTLAALVLGVVKSAPFQMRQQR